MRMPDAEFPITAELARALLLEQHADLAHLSIVDGGEGWDNKQFRLGSELAVRLPRREVAVSLTEHEQRWLPILGPRLPCPVPAPVRVGRAGCGFPWPWSVVRWFEGEIARPGNSEALPEPLATFLVALHQPAPRDVTGHPFRQSLPARASLFAEHLTHVHHTVDASAALAVFDAAARIPAWGEPPVWIHADLHPANVIVGDDRLRAVVDFGDLCAGDPAVDLAIAWMLWPQPGRTRFRDVVDRGSGRTDEATWCRARGWALALGVTFLAHADSHRTMGAIGRHTVDAVLASPD